MGCRVNGAVLAMLPVVAFLSGSSSGLAAASAVLLGLLWQAWLCRIGLTLSSETLTVVGLTSRKSWVAGEVASFDIITTREPLDMFDRSMRLRIRFIDGSNHVCRWVAWQDFATPFMISGTKRPLKRSQTRVLDDLTSGLRQS